MQEFEQKYTQAIWELTEALQDEKQMESALGNCLEIMKDTVGCEGGFVWLANLEKHLMMIIACSSGSDVTGMVIPDDRGIVGHVLGTAETMMINGEAGKDSPLGESDEATGMSVKSQLVAPVRTPGGRPFGCIQLVNKIDGKFDEQDSRLADQMASLVALDIDDKGYNVITPPKDEPLIVLRNVIKEFPSGDGVSRVLKGIDLDIFPGEFLVVLGESGCGKTTMMNIIGGMDSMTEGEMYLEGKDFSHPGKKELTMFRRNYIGYIFQSYNLMPNLSALENLQFIAEISSDPMDPEEALGLVGLADRAGNFPSQLSGGQQQRVSIARALTKNPKLILADEPTAALDYDTSIEVLSIIEDIVEKRGASMIMVTHNSEIAKMAKRVVKLRGGKISSIRINLHPLKARELEW